MFNRGDCTASIYSYEDVQCVNETGNTWDYDLFNSADDGLVVRCLSNESARDPAPSVNVERAASSPELQNCITVCSRNGSLN